MRFQKYFKLFLFIGSFFILIGLAQVAFSQPPGSDEGGFDDPDAQIPIDGGVGILAAAGIAYGIKKVYKNKKKNIE